MSHTARIRSARHPRLASWCGYCCEAAVSAGITYSGCWVHRYASRRKRSPKYSEWCGWLGYVDEHRCELRENREGGRLTAAGAAGHYTISRDRSGD
jgi:hypothetical protein